MSRCREGTTLERSLTTSCTWCPASIRVVAIVVLVDVILVDDVITATRGIMVVDCVASVDDGRSPSAVTTPSAGVAGIRLLGRRSWYPLFSSSLRRLGSVSSY